jgi:hypothetical protein
MDFKPGLLGTAMLVDAPIAIVPAATVVARG